jgi:hypothetical protein
VAAEASATAEPDAAGFGAPDAGVVTVIWSGTDRTCCW